MNKKTGIIIAVVVVAMLATFGVSFLIFSKGGTGEKSKKNQEVYSVGIEDMYSNVKDSRRIVKIKIVVETNDEKDAAILTEKAYQVRDIANDIIRATDEKDLIEPDSQVKLQEKIKQELIEDMGIDSITNIKFHDFVIQ